VGLLVRATVEEVVSVVADLEVEADGPTGVMVVAVIREQADTAVTDMDSEVVNHVARRVARRVATGDVTRVLSQLVQCLVLVLPEPAALSLVLSAARFGSHGLVGFDGSSSTITSCIQRVETMQLLVTVLTFTIATTS